MLARTFVPLPLHPAVFRALPNTGGENPTFSLLQAEVSFFPLHGNHSIQYERILSTKSFDGRSGHRAQRTVSESSPHSVQQPLKQEEGASTVDAEEDAEDEDEWKDRCDDIADLMVKQRHMLLWSSSWG